MMEARDILNELKNTSSVGAAVRFFVTEIRNSLFEAGIGNPAKGGATDSGILSELHALFSRVEEVAEAIVHGTPTAEDDQDPNAPPKDSNPGSTGNNVYGSLGPTDDTDGAASSQRARDLSTAGPTHPELQDSPAQPPAHPDSAADLPENVMARQNAGTAGAPPAASAGGNQDSMGSGNMSAAQQSEKSSDGRSFDPGAGPQGTSTEQPTAAETSNNPGASTGISAGPQRFGQDAPAGQSTAAQLAKPTEDANQSKARGETVPGYDAKTGQPTNQNGRADQYGAIGQNNTTARNDAPASSSTVEPKNEAGVSSEVPK